MDPRNISRQSFKETIGAFEAKYSPSIIAINKKIDNAASNIQFETRITDDDLIDTKLKDIGYVLEQYYVYRGYYVFFNQGDEKNGFKPYIRICWDLESIKQPYEE